MLLGSEMVKVLPFVSMTIKEEDVKFNVQEHGWYFERDSNNTTIDNIGWTPWFKLSLSTLNMCIIRSLYGSVYDLNDLFLHDVTSDLGLGGDAYLDLSFVIGLTIEYLGLPIH